MAKGQKGKKRKDGKEDRKNIESNLSEDLNDSAVLNVMNESRSSSNEENSPSVTKLTLMKFKKIKGAGSQSPKTRSSPRKKGKVNYKAMNEGDSCVVCHRSPGRTNSDKKKQVKTVQFEEEGNLAEMTTEGIDTEFMSDDNLEVLSSDSELEDGEYETVVEVPKEFETSFNNNATTTTKATSRDAETPITNKEAKGGDKDERRKRKITEDEDMAREERIVNKTVARLQEIMMKGGYLNNDRNRGKDENTFHASQNVSGSPSESTIYKLAVQPASVANANKIDENKRKSLSSEEGDNGVTLGVLDGGDLVDNANLIENFISECRVAVQEDVQPSTSGYRLPAER